MLNLIKLEIRRMNSGSVLLNFMLINVGIIGILLLLGLDSEAATEFLASPEDVMRLIELLVVAAFVINASVLLSNLIIEEFKNKTILVLFMYPINRKKLLLAKVLVISMLTFLFVIMSEIIVFSSFSAINNMYAPITVPLPTDLLADKIIHLIVTAVACAGMSLIPLFFGMIKYSVPATITSSILIIAILSSSFESGIGANLFSYTIIPIMLGIIGFVVANLVISRVVKRDF
ncbi:ABC transporter permease [Oceanobacillus jordanicus]|uniref:ABC transporter permease n=1 Tax=Oceanobacillus jordanicus TaxID=2867266 RepID=A0AAW5B4S5_9BACI|nr:ABC transporter permease [Oceanobacillus jordanicus]MCG3418247.1 ABC transporter permease [Oceanobacillus jordanicus]